MKCKLFLILFIPIALVGAPFTYQGVLKDGGYPCDGMYDLRFYVYDAETNGTPMGQGLAMSTYVSMGLFTVRLDFGPETLHSKGWLEIHVRTNGAESYAVLAPRQELLSWATQDNIRTNSAESYAVLAPRQQRLPWAMQDNNNNVIQGDPDNSISGTMGATISGGAFNEIVDKETSPPPPDYATIAGGFGNLITEGKFSAIGGGGSNTIHGDVYAYPDHSTIAGGEANGIYQSSHAFIGGGQGNRIIYPRFGNSQFGTIGGGRSNLIHTARWATIGGGHNNTNSGHASTIAGGEANAVRGDVEAGLITRTAAIGGGEGNVIGPLSEGCTIAGGLGNSIRQLTGISSATIGGGSNNRIIGAYATIPGGDSNAATSYAFAAGRRAKANHEGSFVWGDATDDDISSSQTNEFTVRASGGVRIVSGPLTGVYLAPGDGSWTVLSDGNLKENFQTVNAREVLDKVAALPVNTWTYTNNPVRHMGPTAQDFHAAFALGHTNTGIATIDADGVAFAAIKALHEEIRELKARVQQLEGQSR